MQQSDPGILDRITILSRLRLKLQVYFTSRQIKSSFGGRPPSLIPNLLWGSVAGIFFLTIGVWYLSRPASVPVKLAERPVEKKEEAGGNLKDIISNPETADNGTKKIPLPLPEKIESVPLPDADEAMVVKEEIPVDVSDRVKEEYRYMQTRADLVNIRADSFLESEIIARLDAGYSVKVLKIKNDWVYADTGDGHVGWIYMDLLKDSTREDFESWSKNPERVLAKHFFRRDLKDPEILKKEKEKIRSYVYSWKEAWVKKDIEKYIGFYSKAFTTSKHDWESFKAYKAYLFKKADFISVDISGLNVQWENYQMVASFIQKYQSNTVNSTRRKIIYFHPERGDWKIMQEAIIQE